MSRFDLQPRTRPTRRTSRPRRGSFLRGLLTGALTFMALRRHRAGRCDHRLCRHHQRAAHRGRTHDQRQQLPEHAHLRPRGQSAHRNLRPQRGPPHRCPARPDLALSRPGHHRHRGRQLLPSSPESTRWRSLRALYYAVRERDIVSGASTIPQQLVKMVFLSPEQTLTPQGQRGHPLHRDQPPLYQRANPGNLSQRTLLRQLRLWRRRRRRNLFHKERHRPYAGRGVAACRAAPTARLLRPLHPSRPRQTATGGGAGADGRERLHHARRGRRRLARTAGLCAAGIRPGSRPTSRSMCASNWRASSGRRRSIRSGWT